jgi:hypothetical protein
MRCKYGACNDISLNIVAIVRGIVEWLWQNYGQGMIRDIGRADAGSVRNQAWLGLVGIKPGLLITYSIYFLTFIKIYIILNIDLLLLNTISLFMLSITKRTYLSLYLLSI